MINLESKKWSLFASRPTSLLTREFRKNWYFHLEDISDLKLSTLLVIGKEGVSSMFLKAAEDRRNEAKAYNDYESGVVDKYFEAFKNLARRKPTGKNPIEAALKCYSKMGPSLIYSHYLERILTKKILDRDKMGESEKNRLGRLIEENSKLRDRVIRIQDDYYLKAHQYIKKKYAGNLELDHFLLSELEDQDKKIDFQEIEKRKNFFVEISNRRRTRVFSGRQVWKILEEQGFVATQVKRIKEVEGFCAFGGKVKGRVSMIRDIYDFKKVQPDSVIVALMTTVQFVPYLKKVKAIITDEGGINCHAAVVSREFKIPCIVGTKIATKIFKEGDRVEVDAIRGVVKKI